jgi:hypothetical protein
MYYTKNIGRCKPPLSPEGEFKDIQYLYIPGGFPGLAWIFAWEYQKLL